MPAARKSRSLASQLASGHKPVQDTWNLEVGRSHVIHAWEESVIPGMPQTADYARAMFLRYSDLHGTARDADEVVRARMQHQAWLYETGRTFRALVWEAALHALVCPPSVLAAQLDRLTGMVGMDTAELGIVPLGATLKVPAANGFWVLDDRLVIAEDWHAETWLDDADSVATYLRVWHALHESAVYGADAQNLISRSKASVQRSTSEGLSTWRLLSRCSSGTTASPGWPKPGTVQPPAMPGCSSA
ncbi:DUF5753 domain-containing protein [Streptomyces sp. NPDC000609]|uniref:DUF5753 domain-containing protein n=1 Tax=Streptomyces sp. NPDC000609 TaxID=3160957 RepID=UPI0033993BD9